MALAIGLAGLCGAPAVADDEVPPPAGLDVASIEQAIAAGMEEYHVPALVIAVYRDDEPVWVEAYGVADLEQDVPATPDTLFRTASVAKVFTATLAARLAERGLIDLDRPIGEYVEDWPARHPPITLRQLLGHLAGIRHYIERDSDPSQPGGPINFREYPDRASILAIFADDDLVAAPGERYAYSTFGYTLAGIAMEAATGRDYYTLLDEYVLDPAGIDNVYVDERAAIVPDRAAFYDATEDYEEGTFPSSTGPVVNALPFKSAFKVPAGGLLATAGALARFGALHYAPGFLGESMFVQVMTPQQTSDGEPTGTGFGWQIAVDDHGRRVFRHGGGQQGARAFLAVYPDSRLSIAVMTNMAYRPAGIPGLTEQIAEIFAR